MKKKKMFRQTQCMSLAMIGVAVMVLSTFACCTCDSDGVSQGDASSLYAGAFQALVHTDSLAVPGVVNNTGATASSQDSLMWFRSVTANTCEIYFNPANPLHTASAGSSTVRNSDNWGCRYVPETVTSTSGKTYTVVGVSQEALMGCWHCDTLILPKTVTYIGEGAMELCSYARYVGSYAFGADGSVPSGQSAFSPCLPPDVKEVPAACFARDSRLTKPFLGDTVEKIGRMAYYFCSGLTGDATGSLVMPSGLQEIGDYAFYGCTNKKLLSVVIDVNITKIGNQAFGHKFSESASGSITTSSIMEFHIKAPTPPILGNGDGTGKLYSDIDDNSADQTRPAVTIYVPTASVNDYKNSISWKRYADYIVGE